LPHASARSPESIDEWSDDLPCPKRHRYQLLLRWCGARRAPRKLIIADGRSSPGRNNGECLRFSDNIELEQTRNTSRSSSTGWWREGIAER